MDEREEAAPAASAEDAPRDLGGGWTGYPDGAAYNPAADVSRARWWIEMRDRDARSKAYRARQARRGGAHAKQKRA